MMREWGVARHVQAIDTDFQCDRAGPRPQWLHQMRSDLGRLAAIAEILQVGPSLAHERARLASRSARWYVERKIQGASDESCWPGSCWRRGDWRGGHDRIAGRARAGLCPDAQNEYARRP